MVGLANGITEFLHLVRFEHAIMLAVAVGIGEIVALGHMPPWMPVVFFSLLVPVFGEMGSFALNDFLDQKADRLNRRFERPLVKGTLEPSFAYRFSLFAFLVSTLAAYFINSTALAIALLFNVLAVLYNYRLKDLPLVGNIYIALSMAIPFVFGNIVVSRTLSPAVLTLSLLAFVAGLAREIVKTVQDIEGDVKARRANTLPAAIGKENSILMATGLFVLCIPLSAAPFVVGLKTALPAVALVAVGDVLIAYLACLLVARPLSPPVLEKVRKYSLIAFGLGMAGIALAAL